MRFRSVLTAVVTTIGSVILLASPAAAGTGSSTYCNDGVGWREMPILTTPVTVGIELTVAPGGTHQQLVLCYGTGAQGQPNVGTGGAILLDMYWSTSTVTPGAYVHLACLPDYAVGFAPSCVTEASADFAFDDVAVSTPPSSLCLVSIGAGCAAYVPGIKVVTDANPGRALLQIRLLGTPVNLGVPAQCIALVVSCP